MTIFETERLVIQQLKQSVSDVYFDMMENTNVMSLVPRPTMSRQESDAHLIKMISLYAEPSDTKVWGIALKSSDEFIGICAFLKNDAQEDEIGYRFREQFWNQGFGTELTKGLISFGFEEMAMQKITADVAIKNLNSVKILEKFMRVTMEFYNPSDNCTDRRYEVSKTDWL
ncbi:GNAT family N-acetyltransferase [Tamlana agarivorans]|uniref:GNAT family N-acetyltransferase n=1 Tax=Pseudotamlana agarivorans TaxID=481183 RepID=A0ACC5UAM6_9FLAO|nr:GNAT family N-acetyltransferase [Tamlana agarivorans]MBU2951356.1 GNAT family N-acetyltransferase [Tamlana agarivorans]